MDPQIMKEADGEQIKEVATLATMCTKLNKMNGQTRYPKVKNITFNETEGVLLWYNKV
jgi:hypothetical protein